MTTNGLRKTLDRLRQVLTADDLSDEQLLKPFVGERDEAAFAALARQLGLPEGTLSSRLAYARRLLAAKLSRHGLNVSGGVLALAISQALASACVPPLLVSSTVKGAILVAAGHLAAVSTPVTVLM